MHGASDLLIVIAYLTIPTIILRARRLRPDLIDRRVSLMFAIFIFSCALSHLAGFVTLWYPAYGVQGLIKVSTALVSLYTAVMLWRFMPYLLALPSHTQLARKEAERIAEALVAREYRSSNRRLEEFAYITAHDLLAPLRGLKQIAEWICADVRDARVSRRELDDHAELLQGQVTRMQALVDDLLLYAKAGDAGVKVEDVTIPDVLQRVAGLLDSLGSSSVITEGDMPVIRIVRVELELILRNLLNNAIKHHPSASPNVIVRGLGWSGDHFCFEVEDDSGGLSEQCLDDVRDTFDKRGMQSRKGMTGLGLPAVARSATRAGGNISVRNAEHGRGAIFTVALLARHSETPAGEIAPVDDATLAPGPS